MPKKKKATFQVGQTSICKIVSAKIWPNWCQALGYGRCQARSDLLPFFLLCSASAPLIQPADEGLSKSFRGQLRKPVGGMRTCFHKTGGVISKTLGHTHWLPRTTLRNILVKKFNLSWRRYFCFATIQSHHTALQQRWTRSFDGRDKFPCCFLKCST